MTSTWKADEFIDTLNNLFRLENGEIRSILSEEKEGQKTLSMVDVRKFAFKQPIDLVLETDCADDCEEYCDEEFPLGTLMKCVGEEDQPDRSWVQYIVEKDNAHNVLVYPHCCGPYSKVMEQRLRQHLPNVTWHLPPIPDLCAAYAMTEYSWRQLLRALMEADIIGPEK